MTKRWIIVLGIVAIAMSWSASSAQQGSSEDWQGFVQGTVVQMPTTKAPFLFPGLGQEVDIMYGPGGAEALLNAVRRSQTPEGQDLLKRFVPQQNTIDGFPPAAPPLGVSFTGPAWGGIWIPGDPVIAAGSTYVGVMINSQCDFYTKAGVWSGGSILKVFFAPVYDSLNCRDPFDVKIIFDHHANKWVMLALTYCSASSKSYYLVAVSQTMNPLGSWWIWALDVMDPLEPIPLWADYPGLGFDADSGVYITSNQYIFGGGFQYAKIRALRKGMLYSGTAIWWDYWNMVDFDGTITFTIKPAHTFGNPGTEYLVNTKWFGGNSADVWSLLPGDPFVANLGAVAIGWYWPPPVPPCSDSGLNLFDCRTQDAQYRNEHVYTSFHEEWDWGSGVKAVVRFLKIDIPTMTAAIDERYGHPDYHYFFPSIYSAPNDNIITVFNRCGYGEVPEFISARYSARFLTQGDVASRASLYLKAGQAWYGDWANPNRWGDYSGIAYDPFQFCTMWIYSMYATNAPKPANWSTWIGSVFTHPGHTEDSLYWKPSYEDYAPNGMVDIDQKQDNWKKTDTGKWTFCGPVAVANCFKWFDSKYNVPPGVPGDGNDQFPLVRDYMDNLPSFFAPVRDDHDPWNVDHVNTPWGPPAGPPPATAQPFVPGAQPQPSAMPTWGELVERLAWYFDTDGIQSGYCAFSGTKVQDMQDGIDQWLLSEQFADGSTLWDSLYERTLQMPSFAEVETLVEMCEDVILLLGFWYEDPPASGDWWRCGGHYVTVAGINSDSLLIALSDPWYDNAEAGGRGRIGTGNYIAHVWPHTDPTIHNDEGNVSHDIYSVSIDPISPGGLWELVDYPVSVNPIDCYNFEDMNVPDEHIPVSQPWPGTSPIFTEVEYAVVISPKRPDTLRNHFKTWRIEPRDIVITVVVEDQFMQDDITLDRIDFLSNPTRKDDFEITDHLEHLIWSRSHGRDTLLEVEYSNQFGVDTVQIDSVKYLLLPTAKEVPDPFPEELDHYKAYRIKDPVTFERMVELEDQFDLMYGLPESIDSLKPTYFLTPALKNIPPPMFDSITHYVAYEIFPKRFFPMSVLTFDQFGEHDLKVDTSKFLLVPTEKLRAEPPPPPPPPNHFKTWQIEPEPFTATVFVEDQFMQDDITLDQIDFLSNPTRKDDFEITDHLEHLTWYRAHGRDTLLEVEYSNQFETDTIRIDSVQYLLLPTAKEDFPFPESLDHYKAYRIQDPVAFDRAVELEDQFDILYGAPELIETLKPIYFLTPALKDMPPPMFDSVTHYVAYEILPERFFPLPVHTLDQFGEHVLQVGMSKILLVPTRKLRAEPPPPPPPPNHFKTWQIEPEPFTATVFVEDQFMQDDITLDQIDFLSNPTKKDDFEITDHLEHLTWYRAHGRDTLLEVEYSNQFETDTIRIDSVKYLLLPTAKEVPDPFPEELDHYKAYRIQDPVAFDRAVELEDQFDILYGAPELIETLKPIYFLTPALKDMPPPMFDSVTHYVAYEIFPERYFPLSVMTFDQFGEHFLQVDTAKILLVPTEKLGFETPPNNPPEIIQPDTLYGYQVCDTVIYTFEGADPDSDVILDGASLSIEPSCGTYSVTRVTNPGGSSGKWQVTWDTHGCVDSTTYKIIVDLTDALGNTSYCTTYCHLDPNTPPTIDQPDFLEGHIDDIVIYTITATDPDGDVLADDASIYIDPGCGTYFITRLTGHGTSTGDWEIRWFTTGCTPCDTHRVTHDVTDGCDTAYCTTLIHLSEPESLYWKPPYEDYAPNGMPDIDQRQDGWMKIGTDQWSFCGPCAVANCFKWFDSKYNVPPGAPGDGFDQFPLVRDYLDNNPPHTGFDDHDPWNVDHTATPWSPAPGVPPPTPQPFVPGPQTPGQVPPWGELVERLAWYFNTDGVQSGYCEFTGTRVQDMQAGIDAWLSSETFTDGSSLFDSLCEKTTPRPSFAYVESLVEKCEDVILLLGFWYDADPQQFIRGDVDANGYFDVADIVTLLSGPPFLCDDAADANDDGVVDDLDSAYLWDFLSGGPAPPPPFPDCGPDPTFDNLGCADFPPCPPPGEDWRRIGGHYVTVAGVNSEAFRIAFSDPFIDAAEFGAPGRVGNGILIPHSFPHDPTVHNDEGNVSHDIYTADTASITPGGDWWLPGYAINGDPGYWSWNFYNQNIPEEFLPVTAPWNGTSSIHTEVEYCVHISPWDYRGDVQPTGGDGDVDLGDLLFIVSYLYKGGSAPVPFTEGDVDCNGVIDLGDVLAIVSYLYKGGPVLRCCDP